MKIILMLIKQWLLSVRGWLSSLSLKKKLIIVFLLVLLIGFITWKVISSAKSQETQYQTSTAKVGTLITSVSGSGTITASNSTDITSKISGTVTSVYVVNGDTVTEGQKIADVALDDYAAARQTTAWNSYLDAKEAVKTAEKNKIAADIQMWEARQDIIDAEEDIDYKNINVTNPDTKEDYTLSEKTVIDKTLDEAKVAFSEAEMKYNNADAEIQQAKAQVTAAWEDYLANSSTITAPNDGIVSNLTLAENMVITSASSSNTSAASNSISGVSTQTFGKINNENGQLLAQVTLTEIDVINVKANQKATLTLDAYSDQTFTGKVLSVDTSGNVSSGVTSYPVTILLDPVDVDIYLNMAVTADIITEIKDNVILIPSTAVETMNDQSAVQVLKDDVVSYVTVEVGSSNDSQTEIVSGLNEGDEVVTSVINNSTSTDSSSETTTSPFSGLSGSSSTTRGSGAMTGGPPAGGF